MNDLETQLIHFDLAATAYICPAACDKSQHRPVISSSDIRNASPQSLDENGEVQRALA